MSDLATKRERAAELREQALGIIERLGAEHLAHAGRHEYDDALGVPALGSAGKMFLNGAQRDFVDWVRREQRWPKSESEVSDAATQWHRQDATGDAVAEAFFGLGLYYSHWAVDVPGCQPPHFQKVLDEVAEQIVVTLVQDYGPLV